MKEMKYAAFMYVGLALCLMLGAAAYRYSESRIEVAAAQNNLQQCIVDGEILWQKECK